MKNFSIEYTDIISWNHFIETNHLAAQSNILIQVFTPIECPKTLKKLVTGLHDRLPQAIIVGCTSDGGIFNKQVVGSDKTLLLISVFESTKIKAMYWPLGTEQFTTGIQVASSIVESDTQAVIAFADGLKANGEDLLNGFNSIAPDIPIAGGLAGDNWKFEQTFTFYQNEVLENAIVAVSLSNHDLQVHTDYLFEWQPVGKKMVVTKANKNQLFELDSKTAQEIYSHYLGLSEHDDFMACAAEFPLMILRNDMELARCPLATGENGSIYFAGNFSENDKVQFCYAHSHHIQTAHSHSMNRMLSKPVEAAFIYSCGARKHFIPKQVSEEIIRYQQFGDVGGVFLYGEFFHQDNKHAFLNHTLTTLFLSESKAGYEQTPTIVQGKNQLFDSTMIRLFNLIEATSNELNQLNGQLIEQVQEKSQKLVEQQIRLQQAQKMEAIGQLTGGIAHDFNNILASIMGYSQLASEKFGVNNEQLNRYLSTINQASERAKNLISNMLDFSRHRSRNLQETAVDKVFFETIGLLAPTIPSSINFVYECENNLSKMVLDPTQFQQVMMNLVINARDSLKRKGSIFVSLSVEHSVKQHCSSCFEDFNGCFLKLQVKDDGEGISQQNIDRIFEPFFTTKSNENGSGMGLSVIHGIVHAHQGHIEVHSTPNQVTAFSLYFPYQQSLSNGSQEQLEDNSQVHDQKSNKTILVVDDEELIISMLSAFLSDHYTVITAKNGYSALKKIQQHSIDLIITDQTMPEMTGLELTQAIKGLFPKLPIIISSGYSEDVGEHNIDKFGINHFLKKPANLQDLLSIVNQLIE